MKFSLSCTFITFQIIELITANKPSNDQYAASELERESMVSRKDNLYAQLFDAYLSEPHNDSTLSRLQAGKFGQHPTRTASRTSRDSGNDDEAGLNQARNRRSGMVKSDESQKWNIEMVQRPQRPKRPVKYLPYSPSYGKSVQDPAQFLPEVKAVEDLVKSRQLRDTSAVLRKPKAKKRMGNRTMITEEDEEYQPPRRSGSAKLKAEPPMFAYDVSIADGDGGLTDEKENRKSNLARTVEFDDTPPLLAFDIVQPERQSRMQMDPNRMSRAMLPAMRKGNQDFKEAIGRPQQCHAQSHYDRTFPLIWSVGRPSKQTRFAYQNEFAGKRLADQFANGDADDLFAYLQDSGYEYAEDDEHCLADPEVECNPNARYRRTDGKCNNLGEPFWGAANTAQARMGPANYEDQISVPRTFSFASQIFKKSLPLPSARQVSVAISHNIERPNQKVTALFNIMTQLLAHELINTPVEKIPDPEAEESGKYITPKCCGTQEACLHPACFPILVLPSDRFYKDFGVDCLEFVRSSPAAQSGCKLGPRLPININTAFIDGSQMYGSKVSDANRLRAKHGGRLRINNSPIVTRQGLEMVPGGANAVGCVAPSAEMPCVDAGDLRINQHTGLVAIHSLLLREHNRVAGLLAKRQPGASDESIYQHTRKIIGAILQHITYKEILPVVLGKSIYATKQNGIGLKKTGFCNCYEEDLEPTISVEFGAAAFRFHTLQSNWLPARDENGKFYPLYQHFGNPRMFYKAGIIDELLNNFARDVPETFDPEFSFIMQNLVFKPVSRPYGTDMLSFNIQRGRDQGVPSFLDMRRTCGLPAINTFQDLEQIMPPESARSLASVYRHVQDIDLFAGGISELPVNNGNGIVGPTFACIITEQFRRLKNGDRFWYENEGVFTPNQLQEIRKVSLAALLCINSPVEEIQPQALLEDSARNPVISCQQILTNSFRIDPFLDR